MGLIERVYKTEPNQSVYEISPFWFFKPDALALTHKSIVEAITKNDSEYFVNHVRSDFCHGMSNRETEVHLRDAINRGIKSINLLCEEHLGEDAYHFKLKERGWFDTFTLFQEARNKLTSSRDGYHGGERNDKLFFEAYDFARIWGLGRIILNIDTAPEVLNSVRHREAIKEWFDDNFSFRNPVPSGIDGLPFSWRTGIEGVNVYGDEHYPIRSRTKILDNENNPRYGSLLMKMFRGRSFMDSIKDHYAAEFIVKDNEARETLLSHFRKRRGGGGNLESFKHAGKNGTEKRSASSSRGYDSTKFILRAPIEVPPVFDFSERGFERVPIEVQILTLDGYKAMTGNPDQKHEAYKRRQFESIFPLWFPREVYEPLLKDVE